MQENLETGYRSLAIQDLKGGFQSLDGSDADKKAALDQSFRDVLVQELLAKKLNVELVEKFISFSVLACRSDMVTTTMPVVLLGDVFDAVTLDQCEQMFTYVERNVSVWKEEIFFVACKNNLLRMCNDLLRRLSRSQNTVFCGRILLFLAKFFPFSERSGLNIVSEFNLENLTEYGSDGKEAMIESTAETTEDAPLQIDFNLYCKFWALQDFFRNPNQCYTAAQWKTFATHSANVLAAFKSFKLEEHRNRSKDKKGGGATATMSSMDVDDNVAAENVIAEGHHFFAKFLTNPKLLSLQLSDSHFRRSVLVQFLILFQYLTSQVKFKAESLALTPGQAEWIKETEATVFQLLEETPPQGKKFCASVRHILQREELWNNWKNDGCKEFKKPELPEGVAGAAGDSGAAPTTKKRAGGAMRRPKRLLGDVIRDATRNNKFFMGNAELTKLWNVCPDNLLSCKGGDRNFMPNLETYIETEKEKGDASYEWRALRLLARQSPYFFVANTPSSSSNKISDYLENVRKRIIKERNEVGTTIKQEAQEEESVDMEQTETMEQEDEDQDLLKPEQLTPEGGDRKERQVENSKPTDEQMKELSCVIADDWKKLGAKLGYASDEMLFFESENAAVPDQCLAMLRIWFDDDVDASWDNLAYMLEGLKMSVAAEVVKRFIPVQVDLSE